MIDFSEYQAGFSEDPGYLNFASYGPVSAWAVEESQSQHELLRYSRFGISKNLLDQDERVRGAIARAIGFSSEEVSFESSAVNALFKVLFELDGGLLMSSDEQMFNSIAMRTSQALDALTPIWLVDNYGRIDPGLVRDQLTSGTKAVLLSAVGKNTGHLLDLEGIREVIGDRMFILDASQALGVADLPYHLADIVIADGHRWLRSGFNTGFLAVSEAAREQLNRQLIDPIKEELQQEAVLPGSSEIQYERLQYEMDEIDPVAKARLAVNLEKIEQLGIDQIQQAVSARVTSAIELADEFAIPVATPRQPEERAGTVVLAIDPDRVTAFGAALANQGIAVGQHLNRFQLSFHVSTEQDSFVQLRQAFVEFQAL